MRRRPERWPVFQWPLGRLSDRYDRRLVILVACPATVGVSAALAGGGGSLARTLGLSFLFGGMVFPVYSNCVGHANDQVDQGEFLGTASGTAPAVYGAGSVVGPLVGSVAMGRFGPSGLYASVAVVEAAFVLFAGYRLIPREAILRELKQVCLSLPRTTHAALRLDARSAEAAPRKEAAHDWRPCSFVFFSRRLDTPRGRFYSEKWAAPGWLPASRVSRSRNRPNL